ncbi:MAG TPA: glutamine amidotransferase family protein [Acetobacteraceae bacterium]|jgi:glutamate synthase domain-containing protein 1|nr:glutamine amidotransferase family protein [Acetobacteraceae bacterium]
MCGIVGLFAKDAAIQMELGAHLARMLASMSDRGPDSAGFAVYAPPVEGAVKLTLRGPAGYDFVALAAALRGRLWGTVAVQPRGTHAVLVVAATEAVAARDALATMAPELVVVGIGCSMELYKEVGPPAEVARQFQLADMQGSHGIGHTRMATESAVTTDGAHPYSTGLDQCLVHNGSLSNHNTLRRELRRLGYGFDTENDTEVAAVYLTAKLHEGLSLDAALRGSLDDLDGFYTFVVGTETGFAVLRDPIACKPAVMAETDRFVAFGTEYRALADLPGIEQARVWEPEPATVYQWDRRA